jgi:hypothetical protein
MAGVRLRLGWARRDTRVQMTSARSRPSPSGPTGEEGSLAEFVVAGAHGGAGTTTLAILLRPTWDLGVIRPPRPGYPALSTGGRPLVLVSRNTVVAARRAIAAVNLITDAGERVAVLALVGDGLPEPAEAAYRFRVLSARVGVVVRVPFIASLRAVDDAEQAVLSRKARRVLGKIRAAAFEPADDLTSTKP